MNTEEERLKCHQICKDYLKKRIDQVEGGTEKDINYVISCYLMPYIEITDGTIDVDAVKFVIENWDACTARAFPTYACLRYLNNFRYITRQVTYL